MEKKWKQTTFFGYFGNIPEKKFLFLLFYFEYYDIIKLLPQINEKKIGNTKSKTYGFFQMLRNNNKKLEKKINKFFAIKQHSRWL